METQKKLRENPQLQPMQVKKGAKIACTASGKSKSILRIIVAFIFGPCS